MYVRLNRVCTIFLYATLLCTNTIFVAQTASAELRVKPVLISGRLTYPWGMDWLPDGRLLITERLGNLRLLDDEGALSSPIHGLPKIAVHGQGGLLDVAVHPNFHTNRFIYLCHSVRRAGGFTTAIFRGELNTEAKALDNGAEIFISQPANTNSQHFGCRLRFGPDGFLYVSLGERGARDHAQNPANHLGSILSLTEDGAPAPNSPKIKGALPEVWSFGHRNPQGLTFRGSQLWSHEHGPRGGDEINLIKAGKNYGWPVVSFGREYYGPRVSPSPYAPNVTPPVWQWTPSVAPSGMTFLTSERYPGWTGNLFVGTLKSEQLERFELEGNTIVRRHIVFKDTIGRIRDIRQGPDGYLYLLNDTSKGGVYRLEKID